MLPKLKHSLLSAGNYLLQALFPETCLHCNEKLVERGLICAACAADNLQRADATAANEHHAIRFVFEYAGLAKTLFTAAKFSERRRAARELMQRAGEDLHGFDDGRTVFLLMPSKRKFLVQVGKSAIRPQFLIRNAYRLNASHPKDSNKLLGEAGRFRRIRESLTWAGKALPTAERYVLCDDVLTTGATLGQAAWLLQQEAQVPREKILLWALMYRRRENRVE